SIWNVPFSSALYSGSHRGQSAHRIPVGEVFPRLSRQRSPANGSCVPSPAGFHSDPCSLWEVSDGRALYWLWTLDGTGGAIGSDRSRYRVVAWKMVPAIASACQKLGASWRCCSFGSGLQYSGRGSAVRAGRDHW